MKKTTIILIQVLFATTALYGQEKSMGKRKVPVFIKNFMSNKYPNAKHVEYYRDKDERNTFIECEFILNRIECSVKFLGDSLVETERAIEFSKIPLGPQQSIKNNIDSLSPVYKVLECQEVLRGPDSFYEISIKAKPGRYFELLYNKEGVLLNRDELIINPLPTQF
ncbi:MAG: hypothetical protein KJS92_08075 [Bacteroidetes bacterium]|nr:hypothetical protein [Bacteroidota bacterium]